MSQRTTDILQHGNPSQTPGSVNPAPLSRLTVQSSSVLVTASPGVVPVRWNYVAGDSYGPNSEETKL